MIVYFLIAKDLLASTSRSSSQAFRLRRHAWVEMSFEVENKQEQE